jgi:hypothetical protein
MASHDTVINSKSLTASKNGLKLALTLPWYRSLWVSSITTIKVKVDGVDVAEDAMSFHLDGHTFSIAELPDKYEVLWFMQDRAILEIPVDKPSQVGQEHEITFHLELRLPYMQIAPGVYLPNIVHQIVSLKVQA